MLCDDLEGWDGGLDGGEAQERGDTCILTAHSHCCTAETNTTKAIILQLKLNFKKLGLYTLVDFAVPCRTGTDAYLGSGPLSYGGFLWHISWKI